MNTINTGSANLAFSNNNALNTNNISWLLSSQQSNAVEKTKEKEKAKKKLAQFLDQSVDNIKRFKGLMSYINNSDDQDIDKIFKDNSYQIYQILLSTFSTYELGTYKAGKHHYAEKEVYKVNELLKRVLIHLEGFVKKGWQVKSIVNILEKMLGVENIHTIRLASFSTLLFFLEVMEKPDRHKLELFSSIIDYQPFTPDYTYRIQFARRVFSGHESKRFIVIQATEPPSRDDSCRLFEQMFMHISSRLNNFSFWFELLKTHYLTVLYPSICKKLGVLPANDNTGFGSHCPHELQVIIINYICTWITSNPSIREFLLNNQPAPTPAPNTAQQQQPTTNGTITLSISNEQLASASASTTAASASTSPNNNNNNNTNTTNVTSQLTTSTPGVGRVAILLEIFKQSCKLPLKYVDIIKKSILTFQNLFFSPNAYEMESLCGEEYFSFQKFILNELMNVFETDAVGYEKERDTIGLMVIGVFKNLIDQYPSLRGQTREILLNATLQATTTLLRRSNPNKSVSSTLEQAMLSTTLFAWIKSKELSPEMWSRFNQHFEELYFRVEVIKQIKAKLLQITCILRDTIYPLSEKKLIKIDKDKKNAEKGGAPKSPDTLDPLPEIHIENALVQIGWDKDSLLTTWYNLLAMLNNLNQIKDPLIHELATDILIDIIDIVLAAEEIVEFQTTQKSSWKPLSLFNLFGKRLFETHDLDAKFTKSKVLAMSGLCRLVCRHHLQYPNDILAAFYHYIGLNLNGPVTPGTTDLGCTAILHSSPIFSLATPGSNILVTSYLQKIRAIFTALRQDQVNNAPPTDVRKKSLIIISSLIFYPNHFPVLILPGFKDASNKQLSKDLTMKELKRELVDILTMALKVEKLTENRLVCLWTLSTMIMEEFSNSTDFQQELVDEMLETLLQFTLHQEASISKTALDAIATISLIFNRLTKSVINTIIVSLCRSIHKGYQEIDIGSTTISETIVANHFYCLLDWVCLDNSIFDDPSYNEFRMVLFSAIELGLGQRGEMWSTTFEGSRLEDSRDHLKQISKSLTKKQVASISKSGSGSIKGKVEIDDDTLETFGVVAKPNPIRESAETLLSHCLNFVHNFPSKHGPEIITSMIDEYDDNPAGLADEEMPLFSVFNENALISVVEVPKPGAPDQGTVARLFIRDATGKYVWSIDHQYDPLASLSSTDDSLPKSLLSHYIDQKSTPIFVDNLSYQYENQMQPKPVEPAVVDDKLKNLLCTLSSSYPELLPSNGGTLDQPLSNLKPTLVQEFQRIQEEVATFVQQEKSYHSENYSKPVALSWDGAPPSKIPSVISQSRRLLMSYLGFLNISNAPYFKQLESSQKLGRALQQLDITPSREILKIGLIYAAEGQDDQRDVLHNNTNSSIFSEFVDGLGWPVDLQTHQGYLGGLDRKKTTGVTAPYFANTTVETIFHNISGMPTNKADLQQIHKKRHVGNDIVNIIWSEHIRDYSPTTITSQFNDAHIVIYPLPNGLFRVQIYRKESKVPLFGPLIHGMTVNKKLLSTLVRQTAINAYRYIRNSTPNYTRPYALRKLRIKEIVDRYNSDRNYVDFVHSVVSGYTPLAPPTSSTQSVSTSNENNPNNFAQKLTNPVIERESNQIRSNQAKERTSPNKIYKSTAPAKKPCFSYLFDI
ncbi:RapGAP/RanGAP domain-containing protein [Heterostelium album PN500]|uniref:RapGAP/RanGAP domain-containing protein n=1 Tax=Heterostelium pallidum (strain ATCC 26659 / Pp 5 / PN500) TaxID=670386 RepID=D3BL50_HETP5|nr:RapGAP/RanGAP domain-containing protein [Heterostelium album PN500]EFA77784.1 RapGAP/RanGAP domain-containing protein [Heterostelium album PN500]|eukprot:XP_020429912.1 RapGAP/RanGAP domain-containing protein [Heterostelium album PN500]